MLQGNYALHQRGAVLLGRWVCQLFPFFFQIVDVCLHMLSHDPNYNYDSDEEGGGDDTMEDETEAEEYEDK